MITASWFPANRAPTNLTVSRDEIMCRSLKRFALPQHLLPTENHAEVCRSSNLAPSASASSVFFTLVDKSSRHSICREDLFI
jgi:hypothetical protein